VGLLGRLLGRLCGAPPGSSTYVWKHLFSKEVEVGIQAAENPRGQVLIVLRAWRHSGSRLIAAEISPRGALEATHVLETGPSEPESGYDYEGAIGPSGQELVISTDAAHRVWAHAAASRCRRFSRPLTPDPGCSQSHRGRTFVRMRASRPAAGELLLRTTSSRPGIRSEDFRFALAKAGVFGTGVETPAPRCERERCRYS
jgi:hypothetical protein